MASDTMTHILIPIPRELYDDIIRFSDGALDPAEIAVSLLEDWMERSVEFGNYDWMERWEEVAEKYAPHVYKAWLKEQNADRPVQAQPRDLVWKEVTIPHGSRVRMTYKGRTHYAKVENGSIVDEEGRHFSPSQWAHHIANGTARNAWRDLSFKMPMSSHWIPANILRAQARKELGLM